MWMNGMNDPPILGKCSLLISSNYKSKLSGVKLHVVRLLLNPWTNAVKTGTDVR